MNGTRLIKNLRWLGKSNELMDLIGSICDQDHDDEIVVGGGWVKTKKKSHQRQSDDFDDRALKKAIPEMNSMLSNWTLHGQNLGGMLLSYKKQYCNLQQSQRRELGHFFNTASAVLDTISSMTENSILRSMKFGGDEDQPSKSLISRGMDNAPPAPLLPTNHNMSRYVVFFPRLSAGQGSRISSISVFVST